MHFAHGSDSPKEQAPLRQKNLALVQALNEDHPKKILHLLNDCETNGRFLPEAKPTGLVEAMSVPSVPCHSSPGGIGVTRPDQM